MFHAETITETKSRVAGVAVCDRCGHRMREDDRSSGYDTLTLVRFRAGAHSAFGAGHLIEGDFCDAWLFELLGRYVRVIDDSHAPDTADLFQPYAPRRLYAEHQLTGMLFDGVILGLRDGLDQAFAPQRARHALVATPQVVPGIVTAGDDHDRA